MKPFEVHAIRGSLIESVHNVHAVVLGRDKKIHFQSGDIDFPIYPRSAIKMLQTLLLVESGAAEALGLDNRHLALASSSHYGDPEHTDIVQEWLKKIGLSESDLICGAHDPDRAIIREQMIRKGEKPSKIHNNCSGKHSGLLSVCVHRNFKTENYGDFDHPVQIELRKKLSEVFDKHAITDVIHLAAESHVDRSRVSPLDFVYTNVIGTVNLLNVAKTKWKEDFSKHLFYHVSTDEVYGALGAEGLFTETTPYSPNSPYSASKASSDHFVRAYAETYHLQTVISNCSNNYGPYHVQAYLLRK